MTLQMTRRACVRNCCATVRRSRHARSSVASRALSKSNTRAIAGQLVVFCRARPLQVICVAAQEQQWCGMDRDQARRCAQSKRKMAVELRSLLAQVRQQLGTRRGRALRSFRGSSCGADAGSKRPPKAQEPELACGSSEFGERGARGPALRGKLCGSGPGLGSVSAPSRNRRRCPSDALSCPRASCV